MPNIMTKRGGLDNVVTYEHMCDEYDDLKNIDPREINLGTQVLVIIGKSGKPEVYIADSNKEWHLFAALGGISGGASSGDDTPSYNDRVTEEELEEMLNG